MPGKVGRVWVTRARPGAEATAERLRALDLEPLVSPVLQVRTLDAAIDLAGVAALAFTSANAVGAAPAVARSLPVFTVGDATARAAQAAGFSRIESAKGDVHDLAVLIATRAPALGGAILHLSAREPAADLVALLAGVGVAARAVAVYETIAADPAEALAALTTLDTVLVHSRKAALRLAELLPPDAATHLVFVCISEAAAKPLIAAGHEKVRPAPFPDDTALLKLIADR